MLEPDRTSTQARLSPGLGRCARWAWPLVAVLACAERARASDPEPPAAEALTTFRLSFVRLSGAESCPGAEKIAAGVRARLGRDPFADSADRDIEGSVVREGGVWRARLSVLGPEGAVLGARELQSTEPDCSTLADAVTLAVALVIDPRAAFAAPPAAPAPSPSVPPPGPTPAPVAPVVVAPVPAPVASSAARPTRVPAPRRLTLSLRVALALGLLPRAAFGAESAGEVGLAERVGLSVGLSYLPEARTSDAAYAFGLSAAFVGLCIGAVTAPAARVAFCGEGQLGAMHAVVYSARPLPPGEHLWAGARVGPRFQLALGGGLWLEAGAQALVPLIRHEFALKDQQAPVFQSRPVTLAASLGLSASIR